MTTPRTPFPAGRTGRPSADPGWGTVAIRMFLIILPSVLVGFLVATVLLPATWLADHPDMGWLLNAPPGLLAGLVLGLVLHPSRDRLLVHLGFAAVMTAVVVLVLLGLAQLRAPGSASGSTSAIAGGVVVTVVVQSLVAGLLWWRASRGRR